MEKQEIWVICPDADSKYDGKSVFIEFKSIGAHIGKFLIHSRGNKDEFRITVRIVLTENGELVPVVVDLGGDICDKIHEVQDKEFQFLVSEVLGEPLFHQ